MKAAWIALLAVLVLAGCSGGGGGRTAVPDVEFKELPAALAALEHSGLKATVPYFPPLSRSAGGPNANGLWNYRVAWQTPAPRSRAKPGSAVTLALSRQSGGPIASIDEPNDAPRTATIPNLVGRTYEQALNSPGDWKGFWVEVGKVAPLPGVDGLGSVRVVAQSPAPGTKVPFGGIRPGVDGVQPSISTVTVTIGPDGQTAAAAQDAINRANAHAASLLRLGGEFGVFRLGSLFPRSASIRGCQIPRGISPVRRIPGNCWTAVEPAAFGGAVVFREIWNGKDYPTAAAPARLGNEHTWRIGIDGLGAVRSIDESGEEAPQHSAVAGIARRGKLEARWLDILGFDSTRQPTKSRAARELEARLRAAVESSGAQAVGVEALGLPGGRTAAAVTLRTDDPPVYLRESLRFVIRGLAFRGRPGYLLVLGPDGKRALEWYQADGASGLFVPRRLRDCSPLEAVGWADLPPCPE